MKEENKNHFILSKIFPSTNAILGRKEKSLKDIFKDALFVLDTNSLLVPYQTGKDDLEKIRSVYEKLIKEGRLFVPKHVLREFAKNRSIKISELYSNIDKYLASIPTIKSFQYPILGELDSYKRLNDSRDAILKLVNEYKEHLKELKSGITNWNWSDPVTVMYHKTFKDDIVISSKLSEDELIELYNERLLNEIPPGNKDKSKETNAIGDFVIWQSILELGIEEKKDVIFISNDEKNDWLLKGNKKSISTKFELVDEFWRSTSGNNFICLTFSDFLESQGLEIDIYEDIDLDKFFSSEDKNKTGSLEALRNINYAINNFISDLEEDEEKYIDEDINTDINRFRDTYRNEFKGTDKWNIYFDYLFIFDELLTKIKSFNDEIVYQEYRMKKDTRTEQLLLDALSKEFLKKYTEFEKIM